MVLKPEDRKHRLWLGKIVAILPAGFEHGAIIFRLLVALGMHVHEHKLGSACERQTGFRLSTDLCLAPDISYGTTDRMKLILPMKERLFHGAPDLAVEVLSPSDSITKT